MRKIFSASLIILGGMGLLVSFLGEVTSLGNYESAPPRDWEQFDPQLVQETPDLASLQRKVNFLTKQAMTEQEKMLIIYNVVTKRFTHSDQAKYNLFSNWFLWLVGKAFPSYSYILNPDVLIEKGYSALCSEQAYVLQILAGNLGVHNRTVGLNGHVVMEAWYSNDWHLFDPDLEVIPLSENQQILSLDDLAKSPELVRNYYVGQDREEFIDIVISRKDNSFSTPHPKPRIGLYIENIGHVFKWIIPVILLMIGFGLYFKNEQ